MGAFMSVDFPWNAGALAISATTVRGRLAANHGRTYGRHRLSTDPLGTFTLTLKNIVVGSQYGIFRAGDNSEATLSGSAAGLGTVGGTPGALVDLNITLDYFVGGSANNDLRVRVRKGTASTKYAPFETLATAGAGTVLAYVAQVVDTIA